MMGTFAKFKEKVQSLTAKEIITIMLEAIDNPVTKIQFSSYGRQMDGICYGCAATNFICRVAEIDNPAPYFSRFAGTGFSSAARMESMEVGVFVDTWETAINSLRCGDIDGYNFYVRTLGVSTITATPEFGIFVEAPSLHDRNYQDPEALAPFKRLAEFQDA